MAIQTYSAWEPGVGLDENESVQETNLKAIADAIRAKTGETATIKASEFASKIAAIPTGVAKPSWETIYSLGGSLLSPAICYGNNRFVILSSDTIVLVSDGADVFNPYQLQFDVASIDWSICYGNEKFVAVNYNSAIAAYSTDGANWTKATLPGSRNWTSVCYGDGRFVAVASGTMLPAYSADGITWTSARMPVSADWESVCWGESGVFVAIASGGSIAAYSADGITWTQTTLPASADWKSVCWGKGWYFAVASGGTDAARSRDGVTWYSFPLPVSANWSSIYYGNGKFVAIANGSDILAYYADVTSGSWLQTTLPSSSTWVSICCGDVDGMRFIVVDESGNIIRLCDYFDSWA